jgi:hypothetical protein
MDHNFIKEDKMEKDAIDKLLDALDNLAIDYKREFIDLTEYSSEYFVSVTVLRNELLGVEKQDINKLEGGFKLLHVTEIKFYRSGIVLVKTHTLSDANIYFRTHQSLLFTIVTDKNNILLFEKLENVSYAGV